MVDDHRMLLKLAPLQNAGCPLARNKFSLPGVVRLGRFRLGRLFSWLFIGLKPFGVEDARLIDAFVSVRTEEIALRLEEIRWKASRAITVVIRQ